MSEDKIKALEEKIKRLEKTLEERDQYIDFMWAALDELPNPIFLKDHNLKFLFFNESYKEFFNLEEGQYIGMGVKDLPYLSPEDAVRYHQEDEKALRECSYVHYEAEYPDGDNRRESYYWSKGFRTAHGVGGIVGEIVDISVQKELERQLEKHAKELEDYGHKVEEDSLRDSVTGLYNRRVFEEIVPNLVKRANKNGENVYVFLMDLDHFKEINDSFGHNEGDDILRSFASIIKDNIRRGDLGIRYGGDEFMIILPGIDRNIALSKARYICNRASAALELPDDKKVTVSIGIASHEGAESIGEAITRADEALYRAKKQGRDQAVIY